MTYSYCCPDLEKLVHPGEAGLGLLIVINKRGPRFFLEYRKDWQVPVAEAGIQIRFCPYCGSELKGPSSMREGKEN
jgi:hypothetical protein